MRKYLSVILTAALTFFAVGAHFVNAAAQTAIALSARYDAAKNAIVVYGTAADEKYGAPLVLKVSYNGALIDVKQTLSVDGHDRAVFEFDPVILPADAPGGQYSVYVSGRFIGTEAELIYEHGGAVEILSILRSLETLIHKADGVGLTGSLTANAATLDIDVSALTEA